MDEGKIIAYLNAWNRKSLWTENGTFAYGSKFSHLPRFYCLKRQNRSVYADENIAKSCISGKHSNAT